MTRKHIIFCGSVQGVGFRWRARHAAQLFSCTGWVRNEWDGSVSMEIQGEEENIDRVIDCAGRVATAEYAIRWAGRGAVVMLFGLTGPDDEMKLKPFTVFQKELTIRGCFVNPYTFTRSIALLAAGRVRTDEIIAYTVPLEDIARVCEERLYAREGKVLIDCGQV